MVRVVGASNRRRYRIIAAVLILILCGAVGAGVYVWQQGVLSDAIRTHESHEAALRSQIKSLESQVQQPNDIGPEGEEAVWDAGQAKVVIESGRWDDILPYSAENVIITLAASSGLGQRSHAQIPEDLKFLDNASGPWNFELPDNILTQYRSGEYAEHFSDGAIIGRSSDGYVVVFATNLENKIDRIFLAPSDEIL